MRFGRAILVMKPNVCETCGIILLYLSYLYQRSDPQIYEALSKVLKLSLSLEKMMGFFGQEFKSRSDIQRTLYFSKILQRSLYKNQIC